MSQKDGIEMPGNVVGWNYARLPISPRLQKDMRVKNQAPSSRRNHLGRYRRWGAPAGNANKLSLAGKASHALFPKPLASYLGRDKETCLLLRSTPAGTVRDWMRGRRKAPQWACEILIEELETRGQAMLDLAIKLKEKGR